ALGALPCERAVAWRALATAMDDGKRCTRYRGWRDRGGPCRSKPRASEWIAGAGPPDVSGAGSARIFVSGRRLVLVGRIERQHWRRRKRERGQQRKRQHRRQRRRL